MASKILASGVRTLHKSRSLNVGTTPSWAMNVMACHAWDYVTLFDNSEGILQI